MLFAVLPPMHNWRQVCWLYAKANEPIKDGLPMDYITITIRLQGPQAKFLSLPPPPPSPLPTLLSTFSFHFPHHPFNRIYLDSVYFQVILIDCVQLTLMFYLNINGNSSPRLYRSNFNFRPIFGLAIFMYFQKEKKKRIRYMTWFWIKAQNYLNSTFLCAYFVCDWFKIKKKSFRCLSATHQM